MKQCQVDWTRLPVMFLCRSVWSKLWLYSHVHGPHSKTKCIANWWNSNGDEMNLSILAVLCSYNVPDVWVWDTEYRNVSEHSFLYLFRMYSTQTFLNAVMFIWCMYDWASYRHNLFKLLSSTCWGRSASDQVLYSCNCWHKIGETVNSQKACAWVRREVLCIAPIQCGSTLHQVRLIKICLIEIYSTVRDLGQHSWYSEQTLGWTLGFQCLVGGVGDTFCLLQNI